MIRFHHPQKSPLHQSWRERRPKHHCLPFRQCCRPFRHYRQIWSRKSFTRGRPPHRCRQVRSSARRRRQLIRVHPPPCRRCQVIRVPPSARRRRQLIRVPPSLPRRRQFIRVLPSPRRRQLIRNQVVRLRLIPSPRRRRPLVRLRARRLLHSPPPVLNGAQRQISPRHRWHRKRGKLDSLPAFLGHSSRTCGSRFGVRRHRLQRREPLCRISAVVPPFPPTSFSTT
jgi:hypothetical protein